MVPRAITAGATVLLSVGGFVSLAGAVAPPAIADTDATLTCQFTAAGEGGARAVAFSVADLPRGARVVLERRDGPKGTFRVIDTSTENQGVLEDPSPTSLRTLYRVEVLAMRGRVVAHQVLLADRARLAQ